MSSELFLRRKWTFRAHGRQIVLVKRPNERTEHVLMKAFLWALYLPEFPEATVEFAVGDRYKPDVVAHADGRVRFWGEAGQVTPAKVRSLGRRHREAHLAVGKWDARLDVHEALLRKALSGLKRTAPCDLLSFPPDGAERFLAEKGEIRIAHADVEWRRIEA